MLLKHLNSLTANGMRWGRRVHWEIDDVKTRNGQQKTIARLREREQNGIQPDRVSRTKGECNEMKSYEYLHQR